MNIAKFNSASLGIDENGYIDCDLHINIKNIKVEETGAMLAEIEVVAVNKFLEATIFKKQWLPSNSNIKMSGAKCHIEL